MDPVLLSMGVVGASAAIAAARAWLRRRAPSALPSTPIREGSVTLMGRAEPAGELVIAPLTKTACVAFEVRLFTPDGGEPFGRVSGSSTFFLLVDGTHVTVRPDGDVAVEMADHTVVLDPETLWDILEQVNAKPSQYPGAWATEARLEADQNVYVSGLVQIEVDSARPESTAAYRSRLDERWVLLPDQGKLSIHSEPDLEPRRNRSEQRRAAFGRRKAWRERGSPVVARVQRRGVTCPHCRLTSKRLRHIDDGFSEPFFVCPRCARSFESWS